MKTQWTLSNCKRPNSKNDTDFSELFKSEILDTRLFISDIISKSHPTTIHSEEKALEGNNAKRKPSKTANS